MTKEWIKDHFLYRFALLFLALALLACGRNNNNAISVEDLHATIAGQWAEFPVTLYIANDIATDAAEMDDIRAAAAFWETPAQKALFDLRTDYAGPVPPFSGAYDEPSNILANLLFFVDPWPYDVTIKGHTVVHSVNDTFQDGVIYLQKDDYCIGVCDADFARISFRRLVAHELGHFIGFKHSSDQKDVMYPTIPTGAPLSQATLDQGILQQLVR